MTLNKLPIIVIALWASMFIFLAVSVSAQLSISDDDVKDRDAIDLLRAVDSSTEIAGVTFDYISKEKELIVSADFKTILKVKLLTPYVNSIIGGINSKVAEFKLIDYDGLIVEEFFQEYKLYDVSNGYKPVSRVLRFKYAIDHVITDCYEAPKDMPITTNPRIINPIVSYCENHTETEWILFNALKEVPKGSRIGVFTDTHYGDYIEFVPIIEGKPIYEWSAWEVTTAVYNGVNLSSPGDDLIGLEWKPDGTHLYTIDRNDDNITDYECSTAWDLSSCSVYDNLTLVYAVYLGMHFNGTKLYAIGSWYGLLEYDCSEAWNISSCVYVNQLETYTGDDDWDIYVRTDTSRFYTIGHNDTDMFALQYDCSDTNNISKCVYAGQIPSLEPTTPGPYDYAFGIDFLDDGLKMYHSGHLSGGDYIYQYLCSEAWNISSCAYGDKRLSFPYSMPYDVEFGDSGLKMYVVGETGDKVYEFDLPTTTDINISEPYNDSTEDCTPAFNFIFSESVDTVRYSVDGGTNISSVVSGLTWSGSLSKLSVGSHNITVWCNTTATEGLSNSTTRYFAIIDNTAPSLSDVAPSGVPEFSLFTLQATLTDTNSEVDTVIAEIFLNNHTMTNITDVWLTSVNAPEVSINTRYPIIFHYNDTQGNSDSETHYIDVSEVSGSGGGDSGTGTATTIMPTCTAFHVAYYGRIEIGGAPKVLAPPTVVPINNGNTTQNLFIRFDYELQPYCKVTKTPDNPVYANAQTNFIFECIIPESQIDGNIVIFISDECQQAIPLSLLPDNTFFSNFGSFIRLVMVGDWSSFRITYHGVPMAVIVTIIIVFGAVIWKA